MSAKPNASKSEWRIMALDYGSVRVGVALSDPLRIIARGAGVLANDARLLDRLRALAAGEEVRHVVVGIPYAPDGGLGAKGEEVMRFVEQLRTALGLPVDTWDESRTSVEARAALVRSGMKKKQREARGSVDEMAARLLLQEFMENHGNL